MSEPPSVFVEAIRLAEEAQRLPANVRRWQEFKAQMRRLDGCLDVIDLVTMTNEGLRTRRATRRSGISVPKFVIDLMKEFAERTGVEVHPNRWRDRSIAAADAIFEMQARLQRMYADAIQAMLGLRPQEDEDD